MKKLIFIGLFLCFTFPLSANETDSLKQLLKSKSDTALVNLYIQIAQHYIDENVDSTLYYARTSLPIAEESQYEAGILKLNNLLGNCAQRKGELDSAMHYYDIVEKIATKSKDDKGMAIVLSNKGIIHINRGEYVKALEIILRAIDYEILVGDKKGMAQGYLNVGVVHYYMGDMENTLKYFKKSTALTEELGDLKVLKKGYINIGAIHQHRKEYDEALRYYQKGHDIAKKVNDQTDIHVTLHNMAQVYAIKGEYQQAKENYNKSLAFREKFDDQKGMAGDYINLGNLYKDQEQYAKSNRYYQKAIKICRNKGFLKELEVAYGDLAELYSITGRHKKAYEALSEFVQLKDSLVNEENAKNFAELRTKYETAEKEKALAEERIKTEQLEKENAKVELKAANRSKWIIVIIALAIGAILLVLIKMQSNMRKAQAEKDAAIIAERDRGTKAVFNAQEEERKRISKDLHDGVGQQLSGLKMAFQKLGRELKTIAPERAPDIVRLSNIVSESADEVRAISHQMMPKALTELGLIEAIDDMLKKSLEINNIDFQFEHFGIKERLDEKIELSLYRVVQELVNNIIKHSKATKVSVQLFKNQGKIILIVEDNGIGLKHERSDGHGLLNIRTRVNTLNGELNLEPSPNSGTLATIRIPIDE